MTASFAQNSFLGGEWSKESQGRFDAADYRSGLNLCRNVVPIEEGAAPRRSGTRMGSITRSGAYAVIREYHVDQAQPYDIELTAGHLRLWRSGAELVTYGGTPVSGISSANPAVFTASSHNLSTFDQVIFSLEGATTYAGISQVLGRQLIVTALDGNTFTVVDALTGAAIDGTQITFANLTGLTVYKVYDIATDYAESDLQQIRLVQDGVDAILLHNSYPPQTFRIQTGPTGVFQGASLTPTVFYDGPYLDIPTDGSTLTPSANGSGLFTISDITNVNGGVGLLPTDIGRKVRVFSEPLPWVKATSYAKDDIVKEAGTYWKNIKAGAGVQPSTDAGLNWVIDPTGAAWTWGTINSVPSPTTFGAALQPAVTYPDNIAGGPTLYNNPATAWQLGAYSATSGYPSCGAYFQGRVWLGGAIKNRFDACVSNDFAVNGYVNFAPTGLDGTVADNNAIAGTLNAKEIENFLWMLPDEQGVMAGTQSGEWVIASSSAGEPITATSILTRETTHYGSLNAQPVKVSRATIFIHRDGRKVYEYMANYFTQKFVADNLSLKAKHLTVGGVAEVAYMRELTPVIWCRLANGGLIGCTYKHDDPIKPLEFAGWHRHTLGTGRNVISIQSGPANGGETDTLSMVTQDPVTGTCYVEFLQTLWDADNDLLDAWYVDGGAAVAAAEKINNTTIRLYGLWYMAGQTVTAWAAGLDLGDFTVTAAGTIDLPFNANNSLFTDAYLAQVTAQGCRELSTHVLGSSDGASPTSYMMTAEENFDPAHIATIAAVTNYGATALTTDQNWQGIQWDPVRRNLMYMYTEVLPTTPRTNTTGHTLWDGAAAFAPGDAIDPQQQFNTSVCAKNIDTNKVSFYLNYNAANVVPAGIGGSDGTYRRATKDFFSGPIVNSSIGNYNANGPGMTDPYTGNFWINSESCELYCFRLADNYSQIISPLFPVHGSVNDVQIVGFTNSGATSPWAFAREVASSTSHAYLYLVPKDITATETTHDYLLAYATFQYPRWLTPESSLLFHAYNREVFDHAGNMYLFCCTPSGGKNFGLYKFTVPTSAPYGGPIVGGGFTDITPWGVSGPNADGTAYTHDRASPNGTVATDTVVQSASIIPMYLPVTDDLVLIEKFFPAEKTVASVDPALMFWSCTYVHGPAGTPIYDHHSAFVTGYMSQAWAPASISNAAYAVIDAFEVNSYLDQSDYNYSTMDYTSRWFFFLCYRMVNGMPSKTPRLVLVKYKFVYGVAPAVVQVIDEQGWNDAYPDYKQATDVYSPFRANSFPEMVDAGAVAVSMSTIYRNAQYYPLWDVGVHDPVTNSFWWSGGGTDSTSTTAIFGQFDPKFALRMQQPSGAPGGKNVACTPPFLKLSLGVSYAYCSPFIIGHTFTSQCQILRPASPQESMTQTGPSLGKFRRATYAGVLLKDAQGVSMGADFLKMRPLSLKSAGGTITLPLTQTFSGVYWGTVDADSNYDNMWCWQITRPYPCTVVAVEVQHKANENV